MSPKLATLLLSSLKTIKPHIPMIKFRKGGLNNVSIPIPVLEPVVASVRKSETVEAIPTSTYKLSQTASLEWWQLPEKYKRRRIDDAECDFINSGGSDRIFN